MLAQYSHVTKTNNLQSITTTQLNTYLFVPFLPNWIFKVYTGRKELSSVEVSGRLTSNFLIAKNQQKKKKKWNSDNQLSVSALSQTGKNISRNFMIYTGKQRLV